LVEFALVVPLLLFLVIGIFEFGRAWMTKNLLTGAAREAVRTVVITPYDETSARNRGLALLTPAGIATAIITFGATTEADGSVTRSATVDYDFPVLFAGFIPGLNTSTISLSSTTTMRKE
jgi:Flp pilus assembly protein TadG